MGSATHDMERSERTREAATASSTPAPSSASSVKWRVATRLVEVDVNALQLGVIDPESLHPLTVSTNVDSTNSDVQTPAKSEPPVTKETQDRQVAIPVRAKSSSSISAPPQTEVVALEEGELDPLGAFAMGISLDSTNPLDPKASALVRTLSMVGDNRESVNDVATIKQQWRAHKDRVLAKMSDETFTIKASMLETSVTENELSFTASSEYHRRDEEDPTDATENVHVVRKTRARLEQLERRHSSSSSFSSSTPQSSTMVRTRTVNGTAVIEISQREYVTRIKQMETDLVQAWQRNHKVLALRIAIKCVKQLSDTSSAPQLYPCAFVLVSDILDRFGQLVFERIKSRASEDENGQPLPTPLGDNFTSDEVNIHAKETCRNWFYKTACIRELLPRIYIEIALLKSYRFLCDGEFPQIVARLSNMIKGVGEPMVALYTRLYLALASTELVSPHEKSAVISSLSDSFFTFRQYEEDGKLTRFLDEQHLSHDEYLTLHSPAFEWLMKCCADGATDDVFEVVLHQYREYSDNSMVLKHLCESFGAASYAANPLMMLQLMRTALSSQYSKCHLYSVLAVQLSNAPVIVGGNKDAKLSFLNEAWSSVTSQENIAMYMESAAAYMKLIVAHYSHREAMIMLKDVVRHLNSATPQELSSKVFNLLGALIENVVYGAQRHAEFFLKVIPSGEFLSLMGMFRRDASVSVAKKVLQAFVNPQDGTTNRVNNLGKLRLHVVGPEAAVAHTLFAICCRVHDALDSLSTTSERNDATKDIVAFISKLGYAKNRSVASDPELQEEEEALLMLYIDCRSAFYKLEQIKSFLTKYVIALAVRVHKRIVSHHGPSSLVQVTDRRRDFIKSCQAYVHITIPSISHVFDRLQLLVLSAKVALVSVCLPQMESFVKSAIMAVAELNYAQVIHDITSEPHMALTTEAMPADESHDPVLHVIQDLIRVIAYAPSLVDDEPFYFVDALKKAVGERMTWDTTSSPVRVQRMAQSCRIQVFISLAQLYALWGQPRLPDSLAGVDSNDILYGGDEEFSKRIHTSFSAVLEEVLRDIEALQEVKSTSLSWEVSATQADLMLALVTAIYPDIKMDETVEDDSSQPGDNSVRRPSRSGAKLIRKCIQFAHEKIKAVSTTSTSDSDRRGRKSESLQASFTTITKLLHAYVVQIRQRHLLLVFSEGARKAIEDLDVALQSLSVV